MTSRSCRAGGAGERRAVVMTSFAVLLAPLTVAGTLADSPALRAAFAVVPVVLALAAGALVLVRRLTPRRRLVSA